MGLGSSSPGGTTGGQSNGGNNSSQGGGGSGDSAEDKRRKKAAAKKRVGPQIESLNAMGLKTLSKMFASLGDFYNQPDTVTGTGDLNYGFSDSDVNFGNAFAQSDPGLTGGDSNNPYDLSQEPLDLTLAGNYQGGDGGGDGGDGGASILSDPKTVTNPRGGKRNPRRRLDDLLADVSTRNRNRTILHPLGLPGNQPKGKTILGG